MKKLLTIIFIAFSTIVFNSCGVTSSINTATAKTNKWLEFELPPSRIVTNGEAFFGGKLSDGSTFTVYQDDKIDVDARYYHTLLMQDFGWKLKDDTTWVSPYGSRDKKLGHIYINPSKGAAVYYYPDRKYNAFSVRINN